MTARIFAWKMKYFLPSFLTCGRWVELAFIEEACLQNWQFCEFRLDFESTKNFYSALHKHLYIFIAENIFTRKFADAHDDDDYDDHYISIAKMV